MIQMNRILEYLSDLSKNNNKEWYASHKKERKLAEEDFEDLLQELINRIGEFDQSILLNEPSSLTFKLVRDTRFSKNKLPYNPTFRAHIAAKGKLPIPVGYFLSISPNDNSFLGGGLFTDMFHDATTMIRDYIVIHPIELKEIISQDDFTAIYTVLGSKLKNVPRGYDKEHPLAEYLKHKSWFLESFIADSTLLDTEAFLGKLVDECKIMMPFNEYLNIALKDFKLPTR